jgi:hypothetical protein
MRNNIAYQGRQQLQFRQETGVKMGRHSVAVVAVVAVVVAAVVVVQPLQY